MDFLPSGPGQPTAASTPAHVPGVGVKIGSDAGRTRVKGASIGVGNAGGTAMQFSISGTTGA